MAKKTSNHTSEFWKDDYLAGYWKMCSHSRIPHALLCRDGTILGRNDAWTALMNGEDASITDIFSFADTFILSEPADVHVREILESHLNGSSDITGTEMAVSLAENRQLTVRLFGNGLYTNDTLSGYTVLQAVDISAAKRVETALKDSEERFRRMFEEGPLGMVLFDKSLQVMRVNKKFCSMLGYSAKELERRNLNDLVDAKESDIQAFLESEYASRPSMTIERRFRTKYGSMLWGRFTSTMMIDKTGVIIGGIGMIEDITIQKKTENALIEARKEYQALFDQATDAIFLINLDGTYRNVNNRALDLFGYSREEISYMDKLDPVAPEFHEDSRRKMEALIAGEELEPYTRVFLKKSGERIPVELNVSLIRDEKGGPAYIQSIVRDISERVRAENQEKAISDITKAAISTDNLDELFHFIHRSLSRVIDTTNFFIALYDKKTDIVDLPYFVDERDNQAPSFKCSDYMTGTSRVIKTGEPYLNREKSIRKMVEAGELKLIGSVSKIWLGIPLKFGDDVIGVIAVQSYTDPDVYSEKDIPLLQVVADTIATVIERKRYEEALRESRELLENVFESLSEGLFVLNIDRNFNLWNRAIEKITGIPKETALDPNKTIWEIIPSLKETELGLSIRQAIAGEAIELSEFRYQTQEGRIIYTANVFIPLKAADGSIRGILGVIRDITQRKKAEEENSRLGEQLMQAQKMESIGRLAGGIAHDFNNILTGIMGYAEMLKMRFSDPESDVFKATSVILRGSERAANLTQQLLGFARGGKYNPVPLDMNAVIVESVNVTEKLFEKSIEVQTNFAQDLHSVEADKNQMQQVITNLIINAKDALPGGGTITFTTENTVVESREFPSMPEHFHGSFVRIAVRDNGVGMPKKVLDHIFEPFFSTKGKGKGTGLGLAMVYGIIKNHHGFIDVRSEPGVGTEFFIYMPETDKKIELEKKAEDIIRGEATILVVDDEEVVRELAEKMLTDLGYRVLLASDGVEALEVYRENQNDIDLIILDMIMPNLDGRGTYKAVKKIDPGQKVLLASGFSQDGKAKGILDQGAQGFIQKPFRLRELSRIVHSTLYTND